MKNAKLNKEFSLTLNIANTIIMLQVKTPIPLINTSKHKIFRDFFIIIGADINDFLASLFFYFYMISSSTI